jgi:hypothetical protein
MTRADGDGGAGAIGIDKGKARVAPATGALQKGYRRPRGRAAPQVWSPQLMDEVAELRAEGTYRKQIRAVTGLTERELGELLIALSRDARPAPRGRHRARTLPRGKAPRILSDERVRSIHESYIRRSASAVQLAAADHVSVTFLYSRFRDLGLPTRVHDRSACERALKQAHVISEGRNVSWHGFELLRDDHPEWPCAGTVERTLGDGSWTAAKRAVGIPTKSARRSARAAAGHAGVARTPSRKRASLTRS